MLFGILVVISISNSLFISLGASIELWSKKYGGPYDNIVGSLIETHDGELTSAVGKNSFDHSDCDLQLTNPDAIRNQMWSETYGELGVSASEHISSLIQMSDCSFATIGYTRSIGYGDADVWLTKTGPDSDFQGENAIEISVEMVPALGGSDLMREFIESGKTKNTYVYVYIKTNPDLASSVRMEYTVGNGILPSRTVVAEMPLYYN